MADWVRAEHEPSGAEWRVRLNVIVEYREPFAHESFETYSSELKTFIEASVDERVHEIYEQWQRRFAGDIPMTRSLLYRFYALSKIHQHRILTDLDVVIEGEHPLSEAEVIQEGLRQIKEAKRVNELEAQIKRLGKES